MSKIKFHVGDKVKISPKYVSKYNCIAGVGEVTALKRTSSGRNKYEVLFPNKAFKNLYYSYELENAEDRESKSDLKVGMNVTLSKSAIMWLKAHHPRSRMLESGKSYVISYVAPEGKIGLKNICDYDFDRSDLEVVQDSDTREMDLKKEYESICNRYLNKFCERHDYSYDPDAWVGSEVGTIVEVSDMFVSINDIRYDVDNNIPIDNFGKWYWTSVDYADLGLNYLNYQNYCKGAPEPFGEDSLERLRQAYQDVNKQKEKLHQIAATMGADVNKSIFNI